MAVMVTGGSGVIGLHVARELAGQGYDVIAYSTSGAPPHAELVFGELAQRVTFEKGNILDLNRMRQVAEARGVEGIVHTAALTGEAQARGRPHDVFEVNVAGTSNVLEVARLTKMRRVVYLGSASEYGRRSDLRPIKEEETAPQGMYAETKYLAHRLGQRYRHVYGLDVITTRISSAYGPNTRFNPFRKLVGNTLIAHLCRAAATGETVVLEGGGDYPRDWTYAADTAQGICLAYLAQSPRHTEYNIASGRSYTLDDVVAALRRVAPQAQITVGAGKWDDDPFQALNLRGPLDITRATVDLGYVRRYELEDGLREYIAWWRAVVAREPAVALGAAR